MWLALVLVAGLLLPDRSSEVVLDTVELSVQADGSRVLRLVGSSAETTGRQTFFFVADPATGTYRTFAYESRPEDNPELLAFMEANAARLLAEARAMNARGRRGRRVWPDLPYDPPDPTPSCDLCAGTGNVTMTTYDPAFIQLTATTVSAIWHRHEFCGWGFHGYGTCWANSQTPVVGTHWYVIGCGQDGPHGDEGSGDVAKWGSYINWDFGLDSEATGVDQMTRLGLRPSTGIFYDASHYDWGEWNFLIYGSLAVSFENSCF